jgi:hypothetical protein
MVENIGGLKMPKREKWVMPAWMERYRELLVGNGEPAETLMNYGEEVNVWNNAPLALIVVSMKSQVSFLVRLHNLGLLKEVS